MERGANQACHGDIGQGAWKEVDRISAGDNLGWREREGAHCNIPSTGCSTDFVGGRILAVTADSPIGTPPTELLDTNTSIASFAEGNDGELYVVDYGGSIGQITNAP